MSTATHDIFTTDAPRALESNSAGYELPPPPGMRVLCVDDNEDAADSMGTLLEMVGCEVAVVTDPTEAVGRSAEFHPQVCVLDITMPHIDGCELARRLRAEPGGDEVLLIALTALGDHESLVRIADAGFDLYFTKPVPPRELYAALNRFADCGRPDND